MRASSLQAGPALAFLGSGLPGKTRFLMFLSPGQRLDPESGCTQGAQPLILPPLSLTSLPTVSTSGTLPLLPVGIFLYRCEFGCESMSDVSLGEKKGSGTLLQLPGTKGCRHSLPDAPPSLSSPLV